jgi:hypothetical protein
MSERASAAARTDSIDDLRKFDNNVTLLPSSTHST